MGRSNILRRTWTEIKQGTKCDLMCWCFLTSQRGKAGRNGCKLPDSLGEFVYLEMILVEYTLRTVWASISTEYSWGCLHLGNCPSSSLKYTWLCYVYNYSSSTKSNDYCFQCDCRGTGTTCFNLRGMKAAVATLKFWKQWEVKLIYTIVAKNSRQRIYRLKVAMTWSCLKNTRVWLQEATEQLPQRSQVKKSSWNGRKYH